MGRKERTRDQVWDIATRWAQRGAYRQHRDALLAEEELKRPKDFSQVSVSISGFFSTSTCFPPMVTSTYFR